MRHLFDQACAQLRFQTEDVAFEGDALTRPTLVRFEGDPHTVLTTFARCGLTVRVGAGAFVIDPRSVKQKSDIRRIYEAFATLDREGFVALAGAGKTRGAAWDRVEERNPTPDAPAVFCLDGAVKLDDVGQLTADVPLYSRGDSKRIVGALREAGLLLSHDEESDRITILPRPISGGRDAPSSFPAPRWLLIATPREIEQWETERKSRAAPPRLDAKRLKIIRRERWVISDETEAPASVCKLAVRHDDGAIAVGWTAGSPRLVVVDCESWLPVASFVARSGTAECGGADFLSDGRLVFSWLDREGDGTRKLATLHVWTPETDDDREVAWYERFPLLGIALSSVDREGRWATITTGGYVPPEGSFSRRTGRIVVFDIAADFAEAPDVNNAHCTYAMGAISPDGARVASTATGESVTCHARDGSLLWTADPFDDYRTGVETYAIGWTPASDAFCALVTRQFAHPPKKGEKKGTWTTDHRLRCFDAENGKALHPALDDATLTATTFAIHPSGETIALGDDSGSVRLLAFPEGTLLETVTLFAPSKRSGFVGAVTLAFSPSGKRLVAGDATGEVVVMEYVNV